MKHVFSYLNSSTSTPVIYNTYTIGIRRTIKKNQYLCTKGILFHLSTACDMSKPVNRNHMGENKCILRMNIVDLKAWKNQCKVSLDFFHSTHLI